MNKGKVFLVGAGPGYPGLLTVRGRDCLLGADVVVYDHLVSNEIVALAPKSARLVYAGKSSADHTMTQEEINRLLVKEASGGKRVVRLKGGDPILFGRGAEEGLELARAGIPFEFVPGVSSALAVPAYAGIPLTCRGLASTVTIVTGHESTGKRSPAVRWNKLLNKNSTVVVLMGVANLKRIARKLEHPGMPAAVISNGTLCSENIVTGTLATVAELAERKGIKPPAVLVAGNVVRMKDELSGHMDKPFLPLSGTHILVTRPLPLSEGFKIQLQDKGAAVTVFPLIKIIPAAKKTVDAVIGGVSSYDWVIITSANGAELLTDSLKRNGMGYNELSNTRIAAIGPVTAKILEERGLKSMIVPEIYTQEALAEAFLKFAEAGKKRVLLLHSRESRPVLRDSLFRKGFDVDEFFLYKTVFTGNKEKFRSLLSSSSMDTVTITSSSCARSLFHIMKGQSMERFRKKMNIAAIGPVCAKTARSLGMKVSIVAREYTTAGLTDSIADHYSELRKYK
jgi:uroporphyrinogen III methyltransferase/synthase